ncbi:exodeoxyribonuclease I subunit D [Arthrobacter sp. PAMC 25486]|uniref:metallophosphoesterase family protein n=1 Tax=Arthrobacter sp. PAMC 25486 TaxID=1494608 RepID=UPI000535AE9F|nr:exonuclease SbcCD subunit D C-terminal domain-containing protein [Arthrobacter sp. PAMC 25486]AIY01003.1 exodeoxyribonuclease I subunit D [Arthrobacter sp. PAMC 25486]
MKLLHTSDWHLGRSFHGVGTLAAQRRFADQLLDTVAAENVDVVLVAGDVYDRALPSVDVVNLFDDILARLNKAGVQVVVTSGNHDSATRLGFGGRLLESAGVHLRTRIADLATPVLLPLDGSAGGPVLAIYGIPYLEPRLVAEELGVENGTHFSVTEAALKLISEDLQSRAPGTPSIVLAHTFASGGITSASERELSIGGVGAVPLDLFEPFSYTALGHLHGRQRLSETVRYSGSPLPYSFSEAAHIKGAWLLEITGAGLGEVTKVNWAPERALSILQGKLEGLLVDDRWAGAEEHYCQITLTDNDRPELAMERLRTRFRHTLVLMFEPETARDSTTQSYGARIAQATDELELCCGFLDHVRHRPANDDEQQLLRAALASVREAEVSR